MLQRRGQDSEGPEQDRVFYHSEWAWPFRKRRNGEAQHPLDSLALIDKHSPRMVHLYRRRRMVRRLVTHEIHIQSFCEAEYTSLRTLRCFASF